MGETVHRAVVQKKKPIKTILHENSYGIQAIRYEYSKTYKVNYANGRYLMRMYRFDKVTPTYESPYLSWANLDCCGGWSYDESYLKTAVQNGKKLYAGLYVYIKQYGSAAKAKAAVQKILDQLPPECTGGFEVSQNEAVLPFFICRRGTLSDYYDIDAVLDYYERLGVWIHEGIRNNVKYLSSIEICRFGSADAPVDYLKANDTVSLIITGLLLGYPIESTVSIIQGY